MKKSLNNFSTMKRRKFFVSAGTGMFAFMALKTFPFNLFSRSEKINKKSDIKIELNPHAVSRKKAGEKNG